MLGHMQPDLWQIEHLARRVPDIHRASQITLTTSADPRNVIDDPVRGLDLFKVPARMAVLPTGLAARRTPQTLRRRL